MTEADPRDLLRRALELRHWCREAREAHIIAGKSTYGPDLGLQDSIAEEVLLCEQHPHLRKELEMLEKESKIFLEAREQADQREINRVPFLMKARSAFEEGLEAAVGGLTDGEIELIARQIQPETNFAFAFICGVLCRLEAIKGKQYRASWIKRGEKDGAMNQVQRKFDAIESVVSSGEVVSEKLSTTLGDLAAYSMKWITVRARMNPQEFIDWMKEIRAL